MTPPPRPIKVPPADSDQVARVQQELRAKLPPYDPRNTWAREANANLIGRVLLFAADAGTAGTTVDATVVSAALQLVEPTRRDIEAMEAQLIMAARSLEPPLTWRAIADCLGLQSPQAAAQRWERVSGATRTDATK
jgi:hypothetical protein